ncbi:MAG: hypothetical protein HC767_15180, partial [Akkermansiaceae bacterium]|nr:hypothetical protein [Akkermansiaceae bacterium]
NEFGFDYLRDNMAMRVEERFQKRLHYAIVDEVDSILIDEARTPLIISGRVGDAAKLYYRFASIVRSLEPANSSYARRVRVEQAIQPTERQRFRCCYKGAGRNILDGIARLAAALRLDSTNTYQTVRRHRILGGQVSGQLVGSRTR